MDENENLVSNQAVHDEPILKRKEENSSCNWHFFRVFLISFSLGIFCGNLVPLIHSASLDNKATEHSTNVETLNTRIDNLLGRLDTTEHLLKGAQKSTEGKVIKIKECDRNLTEEVETKTQDLKRVVAALRLLQASFRNYTLPEKEQTTESCSGQANYATSDYLNPKFKPKIRDDLVKSKKTMMFVVGRPTHVRYAVAIYQSLQERFDTFKNVQLKLCHYNELKEEVQNEVKRIVPYLKITNLEDYKDEFNLPSGVWAFNKKIILFRNI